MKHFVAPSLLSADFRNLKSEMDMINRSECDWLHIDIMDGVFVPNISFGFPVLKYVARLCEKPLDVHLMIVQPEKFLNEVKALGAYSMNVHVEACPHLHRVVQQIKETGMKAGVTLNPATPVSSLTDIIEDVDIVMLTVVGRGRCGCVGSGECCFSCGRCHRRDSCFEKFVNADWRLFGILAEIPFCEAGCSASSRFVAGTIVVAICGK